MENIKLKIDIPFSAKTQLNNSENITENHFHGPATTNVSADIKTGNGDYRLDKIDLLDDNMDLLADQTLFSSADPFTFKELMHLNDELTDQEVELRKKLQLLTQEKPDGL